MSELARVSRRTRAAQMEYQRLRAEELRLIRSIMEDEVEESNAYLNRTDLQIGSVRNDLFNAGVAAIGSNGSKYHDAKKDDETDDSRDSCDSIAASGCDGSTVHAESEYHESN